MSMLMPKPEIILSALGLEAVQGLGFAWGSTPAGTAFNLTVQASQEQTQGIAKPD